jgi:rhodanese-related sulfurtransferase
MQSPLETPVQRLRSTRLVEEICAWTEAITPFHPTTCTNGSAPKPRRSLSMFGATRTSSEPRDSSAPAFHRSPDRIEEWRKELPSGCTVVTYCVHGREVSQGVAAALRTMGVEANFLKGGIAGWTEQRMPTRRKIGASPSKWVTREHPKIDRIACPWLIRRFIDPNAEFIYVPKDQVVAVAQQTGGIPYDIDGVEFTHEGERCSFDTILRNYDIKDPALDHLATIVRGADTSRHALSPQCGGLFAISLGLSANFPDDHEMLKHGMVIYDALYTWCRTLQAETHNWPARAAGS